MKNLSIDEVIQLSHITLKEVEACYLFDDGTCEKELTEVLEWKEQMKFLSRADTEKLEEWMLRASWVIKDFYSQYGVKRSAEAEQIIGCMQFGAKFNQ